LNEKFARPTTPNTAGGGGGGEGGEGIRYPTGLHHKIHKLASMERGIQTIEQQRTLTLI